MCHNNCNCNKCYPIKNKCEACRYEGVDIPALGIISGMTFDDVTQTLSEFVSNLEFTEGVPGPQGNTGPAGADGISAEPLVWQNLTLDNGWTNIGIHTAQYAISSTNDLIYFRGRITQLNNTVSNQIFNNSLNFNRPYVSTVYNVLTEDLVVVSGVSSGSTIGVQVNATQAETVNMSLFLDTIPPISITI